MKKVLEIRLTEESPLQLKALLGKFGECEELQRGRIKCEYCSDTFGEPDKELSFNQDEAAICGRGDVVGILEKELKSLPGVEKGDYESLKTRITLLQDLIIKRKEKNSEEFMKLYKKNEELKKITAKMKKEMNADKSNLKKIYEKRILELRKEESLTKSDVFTVKQRIYNLELESVAHDREFEDLAAELQALVASKKSAQSSLEAHISFVLAQNEELVQDNKRLSASSQSILSQLNTLLMPNLNC